MLEIYTWSVFITGVFFVSFGLFAIFRNSHELSTRLYTLFALAFAVWNFSWFALLLESRAVYADFYARLLNLGAIFIPVFYLHWVLSVLNLIQKRFLFLKIAYIITIIFAFFSFSEYFVLGVRQVLFFPYWPVAGPLYSLFLPIGFIGIVFYSIYELFKGYYREINQKKYQIGYLLLGTVLGFGGSITIFPLMYGYDLIQPFGIFPMMASPLIFSYAVVKYNFLNTKVVATQFLVGFLNVILIINLILSDTLTDRFFGAFILVFVFFTSILLVRSVMQEIRSRERIEKLAKELERVNARLKELDQLKSEFVSIASHQLRSPLAAIKGYASLIKEGSFGKAPPAIAEAVEKIFDSSKGLAIVVEDFLNVSRIEQGRMRYDFAPVDLEALAKKMISEQMPSVERAKLKISFSTDGKSPYKINADIGKIQQVLANLIDNAIKYTPHGSIAVDLTKKSSGFIRVSILDTGIGMDQATIAELFQKFTRARDANKTNVIGTGLGLYVARQMVEAHHGRIWAESEGKGKGSTFSVEFKELEQFNHEGEVKKFAEGL